MRQIQAPICAPGPNLDHFDRLVVTPPVDKVAATFNLICQLKDTFQVLKKSTTGLPMLQDDIS